MTLVKNGRLTVPLFHGTSSLHYESILSHGLGGRNIVEDNGVRAAARELVNFCAPWREHEEWVMDFDACECIAAEPDNPRRGNFRYCGTYLSPSRETAATYAFLYHANGGEALTHVLKLYRKLANARPEMARNPQFAALANFAAKPARPLVIEAVDIEIDALRSEHGGGIEENLKRMESSIEDPDFYEGWNAQHNFELTRPIPESHLRFYEPVKIKEFGENGGSREVLTLTPIRPSDVVNLQPQILPANT